MPLLDALAPLRARSGRRLTRGLCDERILCLAERFPELAQAIGAASERFAEVRDVCAELLDLDESEQIRRVQAGVVNFYPHDTVVPYVALAARGPWIVTLKGAVVYDTGGYGMLGLGHTPAAVLEAMARPQPMANIMTPSLSQWLFDAALRKEIGHTRGGCPFPSFMFLNSGSEAMGLATRIADVNSKLMTDPGGRYEGRLIRRVSVKGSFHGRTDRPAVYSDSSRSAYERHLASFRGEMSLITVPPYDEDALRRVFAEADANGWFIEAVLLEPVMGEGDPGRALPASFYAAARELTEAHGSLLLVDSIQAGLRAHGVLSIVDYPGFEGLHAPDCETYSKALNGGQYPLSVLALSAKAANLYHAGIYGNTMTANPRAMEVGRMVLHAFTPELRENIRTRGRQAVEKLERLRLSLGGAITRVQGCGLLFSCELAPEIKCYGSDSVEEELRHRGLQVIHGGANSLRFTPHFGVSEVELDLIVKLVEQALT